MTSAHIGDYPNVKWKSKDEIPPRGSMIAVVSSAGKIRVGEVVGLNKVYIRKDLTIEWERVVAWVKRRDLK